MQTVNSLVVTKLKKMCWLTPALVLTGCTLSPAIPVIGAYYPGWLFCIIAGVILTLVSRHFLRLADRVPGLPAIVYTCLFLIWSMLFWLVFF